MKNLFCLIPVRNITLRTKENLLRVVKWTKINVYWMELFISQAGLNYAQSSKQTELSIKLSELFVLFQFCRLLRRDLFFQRHKILYLNSQPTDSQSVIITITPPSQLWVGDTEKLSLTFSHAWLILVEFT